MMKRDTASIAGAAVCSNCNSDDRWILHHVYHRNTCRCLCTTCVLKLNITSFCPICFALHDRPKKSAASVAVAPPPPGLRGTLVCFKCNSSSHTNCVAPNAPRSPYLCPTCSNPNVKLFDFRKSNKSGDGNNPNKAIHQVIDLKSSKVFLAAAMIAANSLNEAAEQARVEAERKAKESIAARKKAKDALEQVALVWITDQEKMRLREGTGEAAEVSVSVSNRNGLGFNAQNSIVLQVEKNGGSVVAGVKKKDVERVVPGRQLMPGLNVLVNNSKSEKESFNNGVQVENKDGQGVNKVNNGLASSSQHLQIVKNNDSHGGKMVLSQVDI